MKDFKRRSRMLITRLGIFSVFALCVISLEMNSYGVRKSNLDNLVFNGDFFIGEKMSVKFVTACALFCENHIDCMLFSFNKNKEKCRIHKTTFYRIGDGLPDEGWVFYVFGSKKCPLRRDFIHSRKHDLCINVGRKPFLPHQGREYCLGLGSTLITLKTTGKVEAFKAVMEADITPYFIIGLRQYGQTWKWDDGSVVGQEAYWGNNRPRINYFYCAHVVKAWDYRYEDHSCYAYEKNVVCEYQM